MACCDVVADAMQVATQVATMVANQQKLIAATTAVLLATAVADWAAESVACWPEFAECSAATNVVADVIMAAEQLLTAVAAATKSI